MRTDVGFRLIGGEQPLVVVTARFGGAVDADCALDTGVSHVVLLPELARDIGVRIEGSREARTTPDGACASTRLRPSTPHRPRGVLRGSPGASRTGATRSVGRRTPNERPRRP